MNFYVPPVKLSPPPPHYPAAHAQLSGLLLLLMLSQLLLQVLSLKTGQGVFVMSVGVLV